MIKIQEIVIDGITLVPYGPKERSCKGCYFVNRECTVVAFEASVCDLFEGRKLKIKENNYGKNNKRRCER